jgi:hypothetical protein
VYDICVNLRAVYVDADVVVLRFFIFFFLFLAGRKCAVRENRSYLQRVYIRIRVNDLDHFGLCRAYLQFVV